MKKLKFVLIAGLLSLNSYALDLEVPSAHKASYLLVAVSGFKTGRDKADSENIFSNKIGKGSEDSGVWSNINKRHKKISNTVYLTHYSKNSELDSVMRLTLDENGECKKSQGLIMMVNSWGAKMSQKLAERYLKKCGTLPDLTILVDGILKPTTAAYTDSILAFNCVNYYQLVSKLHGNTIENCKNHEVGFNRKSDLFNAHIETEWYGSDKAQQLIEKYLNRELAPMFTKELYDIDYQKGLD